MSKIVIITDTHSGIRSDSDFFHNMSKKFYDDIFFKYIDEYKIDTVIHLGDLVDRRKYINYVTLKRLKEDFLDKLASRNLNVFMIAGNHDCTFKNSNQVNALREIIQGNYNFGIYDNFAEEVVVNQEKILFVPWMCEENKEKSISRIKSSNSKYCMGHLELVGFQMYKGYVAEHGDDPSIFKQFDRVLSGHYHSKSSKGNISYLGSHMEFTWSDYDDPKGFHIFDMNTGELEFIQNPYTIFKKVFFNSSKDAFQKINCENSIVKVIVQNKDDPYLFDTFISRIEKQNPIELQIVEDHMNLNLETDSSILSEAESTIDIFKKYIGKQEQTNVDKAALEKFIIELYNEAHSTE